MTLLDQAYKICRWGMGMVFVLAGGLKILDLEAFATLIQAYGLVPEALLLPAAVLVSLLEMAAGIGLVFDIRGSLGIISGLLALFSALLSYGIWIGLDVDCGCFGPGDPEARAFHGLRTALYRDFAMLVMAGCLYGWRHLRDIRPKALKFRFYKQFKKWRTTHGYG